MEISSEKVVEESENNTVSIKQKVIKITKNYTELSLRRYRGRNILDNPEIVEHIYDSKFRFITPVPKKKIDKTFSRQAYMIHPGYWVTFKDDPKNYYKIERVKESKAILIKL